MRQIAAKQRLASSLLLSKWLRVTWGALSSVGMMEMMKMENFMEKTILTLLTPHLPQLPLKCVGGLERCWICTTSLCTCGGPGATVRDHTSLSNAQWLMISALQNAGALLPKVEVPLWAPRNSFNAQIQHQCKSGISSQTVMGCWFGGSWLCSLHLQTSNKKIHVI